MIRNGIIIIFAILLIKSTTLSQLLPNLAVSGGPTVGWFFQNNDDLNAELKKAGFPAVDNGFFTLGGGGFIDLPMKKNFIRIGGLGIGFSSHKELRYNDSLTKAITYSMGLGGLSLEYVLSFGNFDISFGSAFTTGKLSIDLYQYGKNAGNYTGILGEYTNNTSSQNITRNFRLRFYSAQPQIGLGLLTAKFIYFRLTAGYAFTTSGTWKVDNDVEAANFPKGIKANGFNISLGINAGLFFRD